MRLTIDITPYEDEFGKKHQIDIREEGGRRLGRSLCSLENPDLGIINGLTLFLQSNGYATLHGLSQEFQEKTRPKE